MSHRRPAPALVLALTLFGALTIAGCASGSDTGATTSSGSGSSTATGTSCNLSGCTVVLQQGVDAKATVLGIPVELVGVTGSQVALKVGGQQITVPLDPNSSVEVAGLAVSVQSADASRVVLKMTKA
jgi:hypothetical protein